jgi:hypothetical protein
MLIGTFWTSSVRFCAVTVTEPKVATLGLLAVVAPAAVAAAWLVSCAIAGAAIAKQIATASGTRVNLTRGELLAGLEPFPFIMLSPLSF